MSITLDTKKDTAETSADPASNTYTCGANCKLLVLSIATDINGIRTGGAPTFNDVEFTEVTAQVDFGEGTAEVWYMRNPPVSAQYTINVPNSGTSPVSLMISSYDVSAGNEIYFDKFAQDQQISADPNVSVTPTNADSLIVDAMFSGDGTTPAGNSDTLLYQHDTGQEGNGAQFKLNAPASSNTLSWTIPSDDWNMVIAVFYEGLATLTIDVFDNVYAQDVSTVETGVDVFVNDIVDVQDAPIVEKAAEFIMSLSSNIATGGENTTFQLDAPATKSTTDFVAGRIQDDENPADTVDITVDDYTELEWCIKSTDLSILAQYDFRVTVVGVPLDTYTLTPKLTLLAGGVFNVNVNDIINIADVITIEQEPLKIFVAECLPIIDIPHS